MNALAIGSEATARAKRYSGPEPAKIVPCPVLLAKLTARNAERLAMLENGLPLPRFAPFDRFDQTPQRELAATMLDDVAQWHRRTLINERRIKADGDPRGWCHQDAADELRRNFILWQEETGVSFYSASRVISIAPVTLKRNVTLSARPMQRRIANLIARLVEMTKSEINRAVAALSVPPE